MVYFSIPLALIFAVQSALVIGAFVGVILVLTEQQRTEFQDALYTRLRMQEEKALQQVYAPLDTRAQLYAAFTNYYMRRPGPQFPRPAFNISLAEAAPFAEHFAHLMRQDPLLRAASITNLSTVPVPHDSGRFYLNVISLKAGYYGVAWNGSAELCLGDADTRERTGCDGTVPLPELDTVLFGTKESFLNDPEGAHVWEVPLLVNEPGVVGYELQMAMNIILSKRPGIGNEAMAVFSVDIRHMLPVVRAAVASSASTAALFLRTFNYYSAAAAGGGAVPEISTLITTTAPIPEERVVIGTDGTTVHETYTGGQTPDRDLNVVFETASSRCYAGVTIKNARPASPNTVSPPETWATGGVHGNFTPYSRAVTNPCAAPQVFEAHGFVIAVARQATDDYLDLMLLQYTPRDHFFGASDRARLQGILIGAGAALVIVVSCVLILAAVWVPMRALQRGMDLAAAMRNDEVAGLKPVLSEIKQLAVAFAEMNERLLLARPFLPQSLLVRNRMSSTEASAGEHSTDDDEGDADDRSSVAHERSGEHSKSGADTPSEGSPHSCNGARKRSLSARQEAAATSSSSGRSANNRIHAAVTQSALTSRRVAVVVANVRGFHPATHGLANGHLVDLHRRLAEHVEQRVGAERGIIDSFHGDRFVAAFNTARPCGVPAKLGALAALALEQDIRSDGELRAAFPHGLSMGLSCGRALVGNMGTATMQRLSTVGAAYSEACALQEVMARGVLRRGAVPAAGRCLFSGKAVPELDGNVWHQVVGGVAAGRLAGSTTDAGTDGPRRLAAFASAENRAFAERFFDDTEYALVAATAAAAAETNAVGTADFSCPKPTEPVVVVAVLHQAVSSDGPGDEWLYSLQAAEAGDVFRSLNAALVALLLASRPLTAPAFPTAPHGPSPAIVVEMHGAVHTTPSGEAPDRTSSSPLAAAVAEAYAALRTIADAFPNAAQQTMQTTLF